MNILGIDIGTTTISLVVLDGESGELREIVNVPNGADLCARMAGEHIQDPEVIAQKAMTHAGQLMAKYPIDAIGLDGQMHGILYVDASGSAVSTLYTWQDQRGELPLGGSTYAGELSRRTGHHVATGYGMTTHFWHVINRCVPENAAKLCTIYDYVGMKLTRKSQPLTHISTAASLGLTDNVQGRWDMDALKHADIDPAMLPEVTPDFALIGQTPEGIPVACGIGDNQASFIGTLRDMAGSVLVNMGTGGQVSMLTDRRISTGDLEVRPLGGGQAIVVGSVLCGGRSYALLEKFLRSCVSLTGMTDIQPLYEAMNREGLKLLDDDGALEVDTRFNGTRSRPDLRGCISLIGVNNFDACHLIAGTLRGMATEIHDLYASMGARAGSLVGSGNAIRRNPALKRAFEKVFGMPMAIPIHQEEAAYGAALFAMTATGMADTLAEAQRLIRYKG